MASAPPNQLPIFYNQLVPLNSQQHGDWVAKGFADGKFLAKQHALPVTVDEFAQAMRNYPIVFSVGDQPVPIVLMGMHEGVNSYLDDEGKFTDPAYVPAYVRRYPFLLARLTPSAEQLSLCFDPTAGALGPAGDSEDGDRLFADDGTPTEATRKVLEFCESYEQSAARTAQFVAELRQADLLMEGEVAIQQRGVEQPFVFRGFLMVNEEKLKEMRGDQLRKFNQNGILPLIYAHLFSLQIMREVFARQVQQGKMPQVTELTDAAAGGGAVGGTGAGAAA